MICPTKNCIHDSHPRTGEHVCALAHCPYLTASGHQRRKEIAGKIAAIYKQDEISHADEIRLQGLKAQYARALESG